MTRRELSQSSVSAEQVAAGSLRISDLQLDQGDAYWVEGRPAEGGRCAVVRACGDVVVDVLPAPWSARTWVHEYGGGAMRAHRGVVYFSHAGDSRLHRVEPGGEPQPLTPAGRGLRYADMDVDITRGRIVCVVEDHGGDRVVNDLRSVPLDGGEPRRIIGGNDFYSTPRISPDGAWLAWLTWNQPNMPWDGCELWVSGLDAGGAPTGARLVAGGTRESIFQPAWSPGSVLHFSSDRTGWWNLYQEDAGAVRPLAPMEAECGRPQWQFLLSTYAFLDADRIAMWACRDGAWELLVLDAQSGGLERVEVPYDAFGGYVDADPQGTAVVALAGSARQPMSVVRIEPSGGEHQAIRDSTTTVIEADLLSTPRHLTFPGEGGAPAHGWLYPPGGAAPASPAPPPLLVTAHGGPTSATSTALSASVQYWTSRGFAYLDVDYGGSTGYGRPYRERLDGSSGIVDVGDCVAGARHLADLGEVDGSRLFIQGGSAGGYIVLCAMTFHDVFAAGASLFGIADLEALVTDTHKFEARYDTPYPSGRALYDRSPVHFIDRGRRPVLLLQGLDDPIVPASQSEMMFTALRDAGVACAYIAFPGEQHGFRQAANIARSLEAELDFFARVTDMEVAERLEPVDIANLHGDGVT